jgi:hypothetical protein
MHVRLGSAWLYPQAVDAAWSAQHHIRAPAPKDEDCVAVLSGAAE